MTKIDDSLVYLYVAFVNNMDEIIKEMEVYYLEPDSYNRAALIRALAKPQRGTMSVMLAKGEKALSILDKYNTIFPIVRNDNSTSVDITEEEIDSFLSRCGAK